MWNQSLSVGSPLSSELALYSLSSPPGAVLRGAASSRGRCAAAIAALPVRTAQPALTAPAPAEGEGQGQGGVWSPELDEAVG